MKKEMWIWVLLSPLMFVYVLASFPIVFTLMMVGIGGELAGVHPMYVNMMKTIDKIWFFFKKPEG